MEVDPCSLSASILHFCQAQVLAANPSFRKVHSSGNYALVKILSLQMHISWGCRWVSQRRPWILMLRNPTEGEVDGLGCHNE